MADAGCHISVTKSSVEDGHWYVSAYPISTARRTKTRSTCDFENRFIRVCHQRDART